MDYYLCANRLVHTASIAEIAAAISQQQPTPVMDHVWSFRSEKNFQTLLSALKGRFANNFAFVLISVIGFQVLESEGNHPALLPSRGGLRTGSEEELDTLLRSFSRVLALLESRRVDLRK